MDDAFYTAIFPGDATIYGRRLRPFCFGHKVVLESLKSPFTGEADSVIRPSDLVLALKVCAMRFPFTGCLRPNLRDWWQRLRMERNPALFTSVVTDFATYLRVHNSTPKFWKKEGKVGGGLTAPTTLAIIITLMKMGLSEREAWESSIGRAYWYDATNAEREGAEIRFAYDFQYSTEGLEDWESADEQKIWDTAVKELGEDRAKDWYAKRKQLIGGRN